MTRAFARRFGRVDAIDVSREMIPHAHRYLGPFPMFNYLQTRLDRLLNRDTARARYNSATWRGSTLSEPARKSIPDAGLELIGRRGWVLSSRGCTPRGQGDHQPRFNGHDASEVIPPGGIEPPFRP